MLLKRYALILQDNVNIFAYDLINLYTQYLVPLNSYPWPYSPDTEKTKIRYYFITATFVYFAYMQNAIMNMYLSLVIYIGQADRVLHSLKYNIINESQC